MIRYISLFSVLLVVPTIALCNPPASNIYSIKLVITEGILSVSWIPSHIYSGGIMHGTLEMTSESEGNLKFDTDIEHFPPSNHWNIGVLTADISAVKRMEGSIDFCSCKVTLDFDAKFSPRAFCIQPPSLNVATKLTVTIQHPAKSDRSNSSWL